MAHRPQLALAGVLVTPALYAVVVLRRRAVRSTTGLARDAEALMTTRADDLLRNIPLIQAYRFEPQGLADFAAASARLLPAARASGQRDRSAAGAGRRTDSRRWHGRRPGSRRRAGPGRHDDARR